MMIAPIDRIRRPLNPNATVDKATHGMIDADGNGRLSKDEWRKAGWGDERFAYFDADGNGEISEEEFVDARRYEREFNEMDSDGDGKLSRFEFGPIFKHLLDMKSTLMRCIPPALRDRFSIFDSDNDGSISIGEHVKGRRNEDDRPTFPLRPGFRPLPSFEDVIDQARPYWKA